MVNKYDNYELKKVNSLENVPGTIKDNDGYIWDPSGLPDKDFDDSKVPLNYRRLAVWMRSKLFGKDVRETIARLAEMFGLNFKQLMESFESLNDNQESVETFLVDFIQAATDAEVNSGPEIIQARGGKATLGQRLDEIEELGGGFVILSQSEYDALSTKDPDIIYLIKGSPQQVTYQEVTRTETVPFATERVANSAMNAGTETTVTQGQNGTRTIIERITLINGIETGRTIISNTITKAAVNKVVHYGTKGATEPTTLSNLLRSSDLIAGGSSNTYVNNQRTTNDVVPATGTFEIRQWAAPAGAFNIYAEKIEPFKNYTIAMTIENTGASITNAWLVIGLAFFGGTHYFNGVQKNISPEAGSYNILEHLTTSGPVKYVYQFTGLEDASPSDFFQLAVTNATNNARFKVSNLGLYEGHTSLDAPFSGNITSPGGTGTTDVPIGGNLTIVASPITLYWDSDKALARNTTQSGTWTNRGSHEVLNKRTQGNVTVYGLTIGWVRSDDNV